MTILYLYKLIKRIIKMSFLNWFELFRVFRVKILCTLLISSLNRIVMTQCSNSHIELIIIVVVLFLCICCHDSFTAFTCCHHC